MNYYVSLDWGERKIGIALADDETRIAFAFGMRENTSDFYKQFQEEICDAYDIAKIIIGTPSHATQQHNTEAIETFARTVEETCGVSVLFADEMFTSKMAQDNLRQAGKKHIGADDAEAARVLLQEWLDQNA